jgi:molecular chaperone GrpE
MRHKETEEPKPEGSPEPAAQEPKQRKGELDELRSAMESLQKEKDELFGKLQRVSADYANFQKRVPKQIADTIAYEKERLIRTLLPVLDNFEHTLQSGCSVENVDALVKGVRIIYDQLLDVLKSHNVEPVNALGEEFDPALHEAMTHQANPEKKEGLVLEEFQKGYKLNGRVIRPSRVVVNKLPASQAGPQQETPLQEPGGNECETTDVE